MSFIFGGTTGETPDTLARKRQLADALAGRIGRAQNWGDGLGDMLSGLGAGFTRMRADGAETAGRAEGAKLSDGFIENLIGGNKPQAPQLSGGKAFPNPATMTAEQPAKRPYGGMNGIPASQSVAGTDLARLSPQSGRFAEVGNYVARDPSKVDQRLNEIMKQERKRNIKKCVVNKHATCKCISLLRCKRKFKMCDDMKENKLK